MLDLLSQVKDAPTETLAAGAFIVVSIGGILAIFTKFMKGEKTEATTPLQTRLDKAEGVITAAHPLALEALEVCPSEAKDCRLKLSSLVKLLGAAR